MTIAAFEAQASWLPRVVGRVCTASSTDGEQMLALEFNSDEGQLSILMDGAWRIEVDAQIVAGSSDPDDERQDALDTLAGATLEAADVERPGYDLRLRLSGNIIIRCFPIDSLQYADEVEDPEDTEVAWWVSGDGIADDWETGAA